MLFSQPYNTFVFTTKHIGLLETLVLVIFDSLIKYAELLLYPLKAPKITTIHLILSFKILIVPIYKTNKLTLS